ncbi:Transmembrane ascorbate ferrireductase 1 [Hirschfeldia incana]|nr:Transmembrane ascorbate ferrireductase 1 [Hirschfeldia incana]
MAVGINAMPVTFAAHALAVIAAIMVLVWNISYRGGLAWEAENKNLIFNLHPVLMLIGFIILGGEAIISYKSLPLEKPVKKLIHLILHAIALALGIWGICAAFKNHNESGIPNLYSLHSWIGIGVISLYAFQLHSVLLPWRVTKSEKRFTSVARNTRPIRLYPCGWERGFRVPGEADFLGEWC